MENKESIAGPVLYVNDGNDTKDTLLKDENDAQLYREDLIVVPLVSSCLPSVESIANDSVKEESHCICFPSADVPETQQRIESVYEGHIAADLEQTVKIEDSLAASESTKVSDSDARISDSAENGLAASEPSKVSDSDARTSENALAASDCAKVSHSGAEINIDELETGNGCNELSLHKPAHVGGCSSTFDANLEELSEGGLVKEHNEATEPRGDQIDSDVVKADSINSTMKSGGGQAATSGKQRNKLHGRACRVGKAEADNTIGQPPSPRTRRCSYKRTSPVGWFPRGKTESYLERKIRMLQEQQGMKASLDETLGASNRHLSRIEREKLAAATAALEATETRKAALIEASWCRILKAAGIPFMTAALDLQKAEKKAAEAFDKAAALGVVLKTNARDARMEAEPPSHTPASKHKITASLDAAFEVDEEVAAAVKAALRQVQNINVSGADCATHAPDLHKCNLTDSSDMNLSGYKPDVPDALEDGKSTSGSCQGSITPRSSFSESRSDENSGSDLEDGRCLSTSSDQTNDTDVLAALMLERVRSLQPEQQASLALIVATRGLNALLKEENYEQELNAKNGRGGLGDVLVKHVSRLEAEKTAAKSAAAVKEEARKKTVLQNDVPDLGSVLVKHVSKLEKAKRLAKVGITSRGVGKCEEPGSQDSRSICTNAIDEVPVQVITREPLLEKQHTELNTVVPASTVCTRTGACEDQYCDSDASQQVDADRKDESGNGSSVSRAPKSQGNNGWPRLDDLKPVKKLSRLEMEKEAAAGEDTWQRRKLIREQETRDGWGGLDLGSTLKRHVSKLEAEQAAWRRAEDEARKKSANVA